jgi:hypothetical protein
MSTRQGQGREDGRRRFGTLLPYETERPAQAETNGGAQARQALASLLTGNDLSFLALSSRRAMEHRGREQGIR